MPLPNGFATYAILSFGSLLAILSPLTTVPLFLAMTEGNSPAERAVMARRACVIACLILVGFALLGARILGFFRVSIPALQIAGGLVILRVGFEMLQGSRALKVTPEEHLEAVEKEDISITPLAIPILCGPGTITTGILLGSQATSWLHRGVLVADALVIYVLTFYLLRLASRYSHLFGDTPLKVVSRLMGLLLLTIAVQFIVDGAGAAGLFGERLG